METKLQPAQVTLPSGRQVVVTREFRAPRALVYEAYTRPELMKRWLLGPPGWTMPVCEMDVRVGGRFRWRWRSEEDGSEFGFHGEFVEVVASARLRHTESFDSGDTAEVMGEAMVTVDLVERGGITRMTTRIEYESKEVRDGALATGMTEGMEKSYQLLDRLLEESAAG